MERPGFVKERNYRPAEGFSLIVIRRVAALPRAHVQMLISPHVKSLLHRRKEIMSKIALVTDSTAYIPQEFCDRYNITMLPLMLLWDGETLRDGVDIQPDDFYRRLSTSKTLPTSSQVTVGDFKKTFERLLDDGYEVLAILISSGLSGTVGSAETARAEFPPDAPIEIVDSLTTAMEMGFHVLKAARLIEQGASLAEAKAAAEEARQYSGVILSPKTLEYLHRGGRIGGASRFLGTALKIKPILHVEEGRVEPLERVRTRKRAIRRMVDIVVERVGDRPVRIAPQHANAPDEAEELLRQAKEKLNVVEVVPAAVSPVIGTHVGPGTLAISYMIEH